jgi:hypothetical protein
MVTNMRQVDATHLVYRPEGDGYITYSGHHFYVTACVKKVDPRGFEELIVDYDYGKATGPLDDRIFLTYLRRGALLYAIEQLW